MSCECKDCDEKGETEEYPFCVRCYAMFFYHEEVCVLHPPMLVARDGPCSHCSTILMLRGYRIIQFHPRCFDRLNLLIPAVIRRSH